MTEKQNEVQASEQLLANALGGWRGVIDSGLPTAVFLIIFTVSGRELNPAIIGAAVTAVVLAVIRLLRKQSMQQVLSGLIGVAIAAWFSRSTGKAEDFFVPGLLTNAAYAVGIAISILVRHPLVGYVIGGLTGDLTSWRQDPERAKLYRLISWWWVGMFSLRLAVQLPLYFAGNVELLGTAKLVLGWPLFLAVAWITYRTVSARNPKQIPTQIPGQEPQQTATHRETQGDRPDSE
jgi:hypothetical protein